MERLFNEIETSLINYLQKQTKKRFKIIKKRIKTNCMQVRDLSMKSRSNNSSEMSVNDQKPSYDSLIYKSEINELEEIKAEDSYEESNINDLK